MTLPAQAALLRGSNYHLAIGWLWACKMLHGPERILAVSVEDAAGGAFDDIVVRRAVGRDLYIQSKSSNYADVIIDGEWLLTPVTAGGRSPLERFYGTYFDLVAAGRTFSLELWTNRGFDHDNPLLGDLLDLRYDRIVTDDVIAAGERSRAGKERDLWMEHLGIDWGEFAAFLNAVRWKHAESEPDIRDQAKPWMKLAGLRNDRSALAIGLDIVREWILDGRGPQNAADVGRQAVAMGLVRERREDSSRADDSILEGLPPVCRVHIHSLREVDPETADRVALLLSQRSSRTPGVLAHLADEPPEWLQQAHSLAWEALAGFMRAHELSGYEPLLHGAITRGSPRSDLYQVREAVSAALEGDRERASGLLEQVSEGYLLLDMTRALIDDDAAAAIAAVSASAVHEASDQGVALEGVSALVWAHCQLDQIEMAISVMRDASGRFPDVTPLLLNRAHLELQWARRLSVEGRDHHGLLASAADQAIEARDRYRVWQGPSAPAVAIAAESMLLLDKAQRACHLATVEPEGEATPEEASDASVVKCLANALLDLDRHEELDELDLDVLDESEGALLRAMQARARGDTDAVTLMREAVAQAEDDRTRLMALHGLALFGEVDEPALRQVTTARAADTALIRAIASYYRDDDAAVVRLLSPHRSQSPVHAECLARAQHRSGATADAVETLREAAETRGAAFLYGTAVEMLMDQDDLDDAEALALAALAGSVPESVESRLRHWLVEIANRLQQWTKMENYARALLTRFPEAPMASWAVVHSLVCRAEHRLAWRFIVEHSVMPVDEATALLAVQAYGGADRSEVDAGRLLDIAGEFADSEVVCGAALSALVTRAEGSHFTDTERSRFADMLSDYYERFPATSVMQRFSFDDPEEALEIIESHMGRPSTEAVEAINQVRNGQMPYGLLQAVRALPYAELLLSRAAGQLTAVSTSEEQRERERDVAAAAIGGSVAVDTSVVAFAVHGGILVDQLAAIFGRVLVADELIVDARAAALSTSLPAAGQMVYDPVLGHVRLSEAPSESEQIRSRLGYLLNTFRGWFSVPSGRISTSWSEQGEHLRPWDASLRVALDKGCPLWCDDAALRAWARSEGVDSFGTYALYEAVAADSSAGVSIQLDDLKEQLAQGGIADIPLTWDELSAMADNDSDLAVASVLSRPVSWDQPRAMFQWYLERFRVVAAEPRTHRTAELLRHASWGAGMAFEGPLQRKVLGGLLAAAVGTICDPEFTPVLLYASRYACHDIDPSGDLDALGDAAETLWGTYRTELGEADAASAVLQLFANCDQADRETVTAAILSAHN